MCRFSKSQAHNLPRRGFFCTNLICDWIQLGIELQLVNDKSLLVVVVFQCIFVPMVTDLPNIFPEPSFAFASEFFWFEQLLHKIKSSDFDVPIIDTLHVMLPSIDTVILINAFTRTSAYFSFSLQVHVKVMRRPKPFWFMTYHCGPYLNTDNCNTKPDFIDKRARLLAILKI